MNTLELIFEWLLQASFRASLLTVAVLLIQRMLRRYLSVRWQYALWLPLLIVLLMPVLPESRWSVASVFTFDVPAINLPPVSVVADAMPTTMPAPSVMPVEATKPVDWPHVRVVTWVVGVFLVLLTGMVSFTRTLTRVRRTREPISDELAARINEVTQEVGLKQKPRLLMSPRIQSPAVTGLLRPLLLLPTGFDRDFTAEEQSLILHHELMHLRRGDLPLNTLLCVLMALHWFNPLLWLAFFKVRADREASCDAQVLENATPQLRSAYGHALLKIESAFAPLRLSLGFIGILQRHASLRTRIRSIAAQTRTRPLTGIVATTFMLVMTFLGVTRAEKPAEYENARQIYLTAHFIEIRGKANEADGADKVLAEALADFPASQREKRQLPIVLDDPQNQAFIRKLSQQKGVDLMTTPSVTTRSGQKASIEVAREFIPPGKKPLEKKVGVMLDLLPTLTKVDEIELTLNPRIVEFEGFKKNAQGQDEPVFSDRQADASLTLTPGQTVLLDLGSRMDTQEVEDITDGKTTNTTDHFTRRAIVLVTAQIIRAKKAEKASVDDQKAVPAKITADQTTFDEKTSIGRYTGHAKLEAQNGKKQVITATSDEIIYHQREDLIIVKAPLELNMGKSRITSEEKGAEARIDLKTGQLQTHGSFRTIMLSEEANSTAEAQAAKLRAAKPQQYDFSKAILGDVVRYLATDARIRFISLSDDEPLSLKAVTFSLHSSPFEVLETVCRAHGLTLKLEQDVWHIRAASENEASVPQNKPERGSEITLGQSMFRPGDSIRITEVQRVGQSINVTADYELASADKARISLFITSKDKGRTKVEASQTKTIAKGKGSVVLHHPQMHEGGRQGLWRHLFRHERGSAGIQRDASRIPAGSQERSYCSQKPDPGEARQPHLPQGAV
ncbi:MAG: M56 family metallopeptidase [Prosthecobacter sp.]